MPPGGVERRSTPRVAVQLDVALTRDRGRPVIARTVDLSGNGMRVATTRPLHVDEVVRFDLALNGDDAHVGGRARVVREHALSTYALRVERLGAEDAALLTRFVAPA